MEERLGRTSAPPPPPPSDPGATLTLGAVVALVVLVPVAAELSVTLAPMSRPFGRREGESIGKGGPRPPAEPEQSKTKAINTYYCSYYSILVNIYIPKSLVSTILPPIRGYFNPHLPPVPSFHIRYK